MDFLVHESGCIYLAWAPGKPVFTRRSNWQINESAGKLERNQHYKRLDNAPGVPRNIAIFEHFPGNFLGLANSRQRSGVDARFAVCMDSNFIWSQYHYNDVSVSDRKQAFKCNLMTS